MISHIHKAIVCRENALYALSVCSGATHPIIKFVVLAVHMFPELGTKGALKRASEEIGITDFQETYPFLFSADEQDAPSRKNTKRRETKKPRAVTLNRIYVCMVMQKIREEPSWAVLKKGPEVSRCSMYVLYSFQTMKYLDLQKRRNAMTIAAAMWRGCGKKTKDIFSKVYNPLISNISTTNLDYKNENLLQVSVINLLYLLLLFTFYCYYNLTNHPVHCSE